ncbi:hypothetical protein CLOM_g19189 [Closterium sp. NIES-68]|nr:hypothetical protein CLOM_g19189 [Closterium sp. NIES-68]
MLVSLINHLFSHTSTRVQLSQFPLHYSKSQVSTSWDLVSAKDPKGFSQPNRSTVALLQWAWVTLDRRSQNSHI